MEMLREIGYCHGIENYSRHLSGRKPGQNPPTLMDYLPKDALVIIDESHVTVPQIRGMYPGDRSRKEALVEYGFRLPSAFDNRPLTFDGVHAPSCRRRSTSRRRPGPYELQARRAGAGSRAARSRAGRWRSRSSGRPASWIPRSRCGPAGVQVDDLMAEVRARAERGRAGAHHHADQAHGRGPDRVLPAERAPRPLPALRHRHAGAGRAHPRPAPGQVRRASSASTCCARGSTCPRSRWWRSSTPTRRATCARRPR